MIRRFFERLLLGPDRPAVDVEEREVVWLRHQVEELTRELADRDDAPTAPLPVDVIARAAEQEAGNKDLDAEVTQLRKTTLDLTIERDTLLADNKRLRADRRLGPASADHADQLAEENRRLEREVNRLRRSSPATRDELLRARETVAGLEERLARAEGRAHGRPYDRSGRRT